MASLNPITGVLGQQKAAHLLRRATFGPNINAINQYAAMDIDDAIENLFISDPEPNLPLDPLTGTDWIHPNTTHPDVFISTYSDKTCAWWIDTIVNSGMNLSERMTWFCYTHFPMILSRIENVPQFPVDYLRLLRFYALGNYKELTKALCINNGMLIHLDGHLNVKGVPQENFAREFLELFTVGKGADQGAGNYTTFTEDDMRMATKVFTGWNYDYTFSTIDPITGIPTGKVKATGTTATQHDVSSKQFSSAFNNTLIETTNVSGGNTTVQAVYDELDEFIDMIFNSEHTARNICRRLYRTFVYYNITEEIENDIIAPLASVLMSNNYEIKPVLEVLLKSEHFYDLDTPPTSDDNIGAIIKSPMDMVAGTIRLFELTTPTQEEDYNKNLQIFRTLYHNLSLQGLELFEPYDVAGHDAYFQFPDFQRYWISSNYLANRYKFTSDLIDGFMDEFGTTLLKLDIVEFVKNNCSNPGNATTLLEEMVSWLLPIELPTNRFNYFKTNVLLDQLSEINWSNEWNNFINSSDDTNVRIQLEKLAIALMQSPEYQLY